MFDIGDIVKHKQDDRGNKIVFGIVIGLPDKWNRCSVDWKEYGVISYNTNQLAFIMPFSQIDFQDKIKDRLGE